MRGQLSVARWLSPLGNRVVRVDMRLALPGDRLGGGWGLPVLERDMGELPTQAGGPRGPTRLRPVGGSTL